MILCEDTRHTRVLLDRHGISGKLVSYHEHNEAKRAAEVLPRMEAGERFALVSDAGMPAISDPGARLVAAALERGVPVTVLPGPTAVDTALVASGFPAERYQFVGFLPRGARALASLWEELASWPLPGGGFRIATAATGDLALARRRPACARGCRVPRADEEVRGGGARDGSRAGGALRGSRRRVRSRSCSGPGARARTSVQRSRRSASSSPPGVPRRQAADVVSRLTGASRNELYRRTL